MTGEAKRGISWNWNTARGYRDDAAAVTESPESSTSPQHSVMGNSAVASRKSPRKPLPAELPCETHRLLPAETACGGEMKIMGECKTLFEQLEIINSAFKVIETVRPKLACNRCDVIVQAPFCAKHPGAANF